MKFVTQMKRNLMRQSKNRQVWLNGHFIDVSKTANEMHDKLQLTQNTKEAKQIKMSASLVPQLYIRDLLR